MPRLVRTTRQSRSESSNKNHADFTVLPPTSPETIRCHPDMPAGGRHRIGVTRPRRLAAAPPFTRAARLVAVKGDPTVPASPSPSASRPLWPLARQRAGVARPAPWRRWSWASCSAWARRGCGHKIGDSCSSGADCDPSGGNRTCDISQPGGYCIIEGCDARSCPGEAVCVRFFPEQPLLDPAKACDPGAAADCTAAVAACTATPATCAPPAAGRLLRRGRGVSAGCAQSRRGGLRSHQPGEARVRAVVRG